MFKFGRATAWVGVLACAFLCLPAVVLGEMSPAQEQKAKKRSRPVPGTDLFVAAPLRKIKIEITGAALEQLRRDNRQYARGTFRDGETVLRDVGVHLKGAAGSFRGLEDRPALTVNFNKFTPDQNWHGLQKIHLNNSVQDGSYLTENLCGELFRQAGVPAARTCNARVELNGRDLGVYVLKEGFDKTFVRQYYGKAKGNLYDGGFLRDVDATLDKISGSATKAQPELKALAAAAREPDLKQRWERLQALLEMDRFISFCALETMCWDWDGYPMNRNNFKLYWDPDSNRITFFPHGMDQMFWEPQGPILPNFNGLVARAVVQTPEGARLYRTRMTELLTNVFQVEAITNRANEYAKFIRASIAERDPNSARDYDGQVRRIRDLVARRAVYLTQQLIGSAPKSVTFANGQVKLGGWQTEYEPSVARREQGRGPGGKNTLTITSGARTTASWRTKVTLPGGRYRFEATARTAGVVAVPDEVGAGAGVRISGAKQKRPNQLAGDAFWETIGYEFDVAAPSDEVVLVCELRASQGQVWFDEDSLRLVKVK